MRIYHDMGHTMRLCMRIVRSSNSSGTLVDLRLRCLAARAAAPGDVCFSANGSDGIPSAGAAGPAALRFACMSQGWLHKQQQSDALYCVPCDDGAIHITYIASWVDTICPSV